MAEASNLQSKFKYEKSNIKEGNTTRINASMTVTLSHFFNAKEKILKSFNDYTELMREAKYRSLQGKETKY